MATGITLPTATFDWSSHPDIRAARDPATPAVVLDEMAGRLLQSGIIADVAEASLAWLAERDTTGGIAIPHGVAGNPNTPTPLLFQLAKTFPRQVLANPILPLLLLENPEIFLRQDPNALLALLRCPELPAAVVRQLQSHPNECVQSAARLHVQVCGMDEPAWEELAHAEFCAAEFAFAELSYYRYHPNSVFLVPYTLPSWFLTALCANRSEIIQYAAQMNIRSRYERHQPMSLSPRKLSRGMIGKIRGMMRKIQENDFYRAMQERHGVLYHHLHKPHKSVEALAELAVNTDSQVRWLMARRPTIDLATLRRLARDPVPEVRDMVLYHPRLPLAWAHEICVGLLAMDLPITSLFYRVLAFASPLLSPRRLLAHTGAPDWRERYAIARNPRTPDIALAELADDGVGLVRAAARAQVRARLVWTLNHMLTRWLPPPSRQPHS